MHLPYVVRHLCVLWGTWVFATTIASSETAVVGPKIQFEQPRHEFGRVRSGAQLKHEFSFTNVGTADLVISNVRPSCGCTTLTEWTRLIPPGGKGSLPLEFNSNGLLGPVQKTLLVQCNDPAQPAVVLTLTGVIWQPVEIYPTVALIHMPPNTPQTFSTTLRVVNQMEAPLKLEPPVSSVPQLRARFEETTPGKEFALVVDTVPPFPHQDIQATIRFGTSSPEMPTAEVSVIVIAQPEIIVSPTQLYLPAQPPDVPEPYLIEIKNQSTGPITLAAPACDAPGTKVELRETEPGRQFQLAVSFPADYRPDPNKSFSITVKTSHATQPVITIPLFAAPSLSPTPTPPSPSRGQ